jgi:hypothetical protein
MFPNTTIEELTGDAVYEFAERTPIYLELLDYYAQLYDYPFMQERWKCMDVNGRTGTFWWVMNEAWAEYGTVNPDVPLRWLAISKRALQWRHMPSNFHPWALAILESFDLPRYQKVYQLPAEEYAAVSSDLPVVLKGLREYPKDQFTPPIDESNWGLSDQ